MGFWQNLAGTTSSFLRIGLAGVRLKNVAGDLVLRNAADGADAAITTSRVNMSGDVLDINSDAAGSAADWKYSLTRPATGMTAALNITLPPDAGTNGYVLKTNGAGVSSWAPPDSLMPLTSVDTTTLSFGTVSPETMFNLPANGVVTQIDVIIDTPFNGTAPVLSIGIFGTLSKYLGTGDVNLKGTAGDVYSVFPTNIPAGTAEAIIATYVADGSSVGSARMLVFYTIPG